MNRILIVLALAVLAACEKPNLESTGGGYGEIERAPVDTAAPGVAAGAGTSARP